MRYTINDYHGTEISFSFDGYLVEINVDTVVLHLDKEGFKDFRKAVGYVWQEVEQSA